MVPDFATPLGDRRGVPRARFAVIGDFRIMSVASLDELKEELAFTGDLGTADDAMMQRHLDAAQAVIERSLGFTLAEEYPDPGDLPAPIKQAVLWLAVDYYEGRGVPQRGDSLPPHVEQIVCAYREWSF